LELFKSSTLINEGYNDLVNEHENLVHKVRQEVIVELQEARAQGDLSENADYDAAREHQAQVEGRIRELEAMIKNAEIITDQVASNLIF
jgi:transcription elongation factor GreA